jgi:diguanylate cyclase
MIGGKAARVQRAAGDRDAAAGRAPSDALFDRVGAFLRQHRLSPDPDHYAFAYQVVSQPEGALAAAVARLTDDGVRLTRTDVESLGGAVRAAGAAASTSDSEHRAARLTAEAHAQVAAFVGIAKAARDEAREFGRDLAEQAAGMARSPRTAQGPAPGGAPADDGADEVIRLAAAMVSRVRQAEVRLADATREADGLRMELEEARVTARRDPLTGLPNRRALDEAFAAADRSRPLFVAICDVDRFKRINDEHGHAVGDRVLRAIGGALSAACGEHLVVRHGGEEFALLLSGGTSDQALAMVEAAREAVANRRFRTRDTDQPINRVTVSAGLTEVRPGETLEDALTRADRHLYAAKAAGRDCCRSA